MIHNHEYAQQSKCLMTAPVQSAPLSSRFEKESGAKMLFSYHAGDFIRDNAVVVGPDDEAENTQARGWFGSQSTEELPRSGSLRLFSSQVSLSPDRQLVATLMAAQLIVTAVGK